MVIAIALQLDAVVSHEMYRNHWEMDDHNHLACIVCRKLLHNQLYL